MHYYFAPMEGLTDSIYRSVHHQFFSGVDAYYMPFISPTVHRCLTNREAREVPFAETVPFRAVPQLMTKVADDFLWAAQECKNRGYDEVNLNVGCPSGTVVAKKKGAGMLEDPDGLDRFLDTIFEKSPLPISLKTRLGLTDAQEFPRILEIYTRYPITDLTIHPRVRKQFYDGDVDMEMFRYALGNSKNPLCFNGNLRNLSEVKAFEREFPQIDAVMIGRGLIGNPAMLEPGGEKKLEAFHDALLETYIVEFGGARNAMFRMKENWRHMIWMFEGNEKLWKKLRKCTDVNEYRSIVREIFGTLSMYTHLQPDW